ncbi:MAG TPA: hypothetical protein VHB21_26925 [Minicystis sp.]|nr:hypothetical protein [Minicystis sp.]
MGTRHPHAAVLAALCAFALAASACDGNSDIGGFGGGGSGQGGGAASGGGGGALRKVDKVDIVFGIDNSASMADKQEIMSLALSDMIESLSNPPCFDSSGNIVGPSQNGSCPAGSHTAYAPVVDIHVGVVSSSLGGHGNGLNGVCDPSQGGHQNDMGHLIDRAPGGGTVPTYKHLGYLQWDPLQKLDPPGDSDVATFTSKVRDLVIGAGQDGCGFEAQMESWYRFLADPEPYETIDFDSATQTFVPHGVDQTVLEQRAQFLRPDSLLVVAMLSDEDDCSIKEYSYFPFAAMITDGAGNPFELPRARAVCKTNPDDPCCGSCAIDPPDGCPADPTCEQNGGMLTQAEDPVNLRCWNQKRRFGIDFSYPPDRYIAALQSDKVPNRNGELVPNPIFSYNKPEDMGKPLRDPGLALLTGIVGVPWEDVARDPHDLTKGLKDDAELAAATLPGGHTTWDALVGTKPYSDPLDPFMIASRTPRSGTNPFMGASIEPPSTSTPNPINGHEYDTDAIPGSVGDLEYACTFPLAMPRDCSVATGNCDCENATNVGENPLCGASTPTTQIAAKAYPGQRQLTVLKGLGAQGVVASICPSEASNENALDYAYRPAMRAVIERVRDRLQSQ